MRRSLITVARSRGAGSKVVRTLARAHSGHGHSHDHSHSPPAQPRTEPGPRPPLHIGLEMTRGLQNLGRMLESYAEASVTAYQDTFDSVWDRRGLTWRQGPEGPIATSVAEELEALRERRVSERGLPVSTPSLLSLRFSDSRTALARVLGADGRERFLSCLRLDEASAHDGWQIVCELVGLAADEAPALADHPDHPAHGAGLALASDLVQRYLALEHVDPQRAASRGAKLGSAGIFHPGASLLSVGEAPHDEAPAAWSAPAGSLLEVPLATYLAAAAAQAPHAPASSSVDAVASVEMLAGGGVACATVRVGNESRTRVFEDHLMLAVMPGGQRAAVQGRPGAAEDAARPSFVAAADGARPANRPAEVRDDKARRPRAKAEPREWRIVSKTFAPRPWV